MEIADNIRRIKDNLFLIPEARFDSLITDTGYRDSLIYLVACVVLSLPIFFIIDSLASGPAAAVFSTLFYAVFFLPVAYLMYAIQFVLLKLVGGKATFLQSVQVFIYGSTLMLIVGQMPLISFIAGLIMIANVVIGSARVHKISVLRSIIALLVIPIILMIVLMAAAALFLGYLMFGPA